MHDPALCRRHNLTCSECRTGDYAVRQDGGGGTGGDLGVAVPPGSAPPLVLRDVGGWTANDWRRWNRGEWQDPSSGSGDRAAEPQPAPSADPHGCAFPHQAPKRRANKKRGGKKRSRKSRDGGEEPPPPEGSTDEEEEDAEFWQSVGAVPKSRPGAPGGHAGERVGESKIPAPTSSSSPSPSASASSALEDRLAELGWSDDSSPPLLEGSTDEDEKENSCCQPNRNFVEYKLIL